MSKGCGGCPTSSQCYVGSGTDSIHQHTNGEPNYDVRHAEAFVAAERAAVAALRQFLTSHLRELGVTVSLETRTPAQGVGFTS